MWGWRGAGDRSRERVEGSGGVCSVGTLHDACTREGALNAADKKCNVRNVVRAKVLAQAIDTRGRTR